MLKLRYAASLLAFSLLASSVFAGTVPAAAPASGSLFDRLIAANGGEIPWPLGGLSALVGRHADGPISPVVIPTGRSLSRFSNGSKMPRVLITATVDRPNGNQREEVVSAPLLARLQLGDLFIAFGKIQQS